MAHLHIPSKLPDVGTTIFTTMSAMAQEYGAINLSQGFPDYDIDPVLKGLVDHYVQNGYNQYAPMAGVYQLRMQLSHKINRCYGYQPDADSEITITNGATEAIYLSLIHI